VVEHLTPIPKIEGSNPAIRIGSEKMTDKMPLHSALQHSALQRIVIILRAVMLLVAFSLLCCVIVQSVVRQSVVAPS
jgi:hypothetical protein